VDALVEIKEKVIKDFYAYMHQLNKGNINAPY
jgi:hypothetical protein